MIADGRTPPHNLDTEAAVLSACLLKRDALDAVADILRREHFWSQANGDIFGAALDLAAKSEPVDTVTVAGALRDSGRLQSVGGMAYLAQVTDASPAIAHVEAHARQLRDLWRLRQFIETTRAASVHAYGAIGDVQGFLDEQAAKFAPIIEAERSSALGTLRDSLEEMFAAIDSAGIGTSRVARTGFGSYDAITNGWDPGDLVIWAGRPGMGKTSAVCSAAVNLAAETKADGFPKNEVLIFSLEMPRIQIATRMACAEASVDVNRVKTGAITGEERVRLAQAADFLKALPIHIDDTPGMTPIAMRSKARRIAANAERFGRRLVMVATDHAQIANVEGTAGKNATRTREIGKMSGMFKATAKELGCAWVLLSQLGREVEKRTNKRPLMSDLRESGDLEQDADNITFVYRDEYYDEQAGRQPKPETRGVAELIVSKQRNGPTGTAFVKFEGRFTRFSDLEQSRIDALRDHTD